MGGLECSRLAAAILRFLGLLLNPLQFVTIYTSEDKFPTI
jgi:hypothetical protein